MVRDTAVRLSLALFLCTGLSGASLLEGHYQVVSLTYVQDDDGRQRGFNNTGLYIAADERRIRIAGAWRGIPISRDMIVDRSIGDTLVLRDAESPLSVYKFRIRNNIITGRHAVHFDDGTRHTIDASATVRKLNRDEVDRLKSIVNF